MIKINLQEMCDLVRALPYQTVGNFVVGSVKLYKLEDGDYIARENRVIYYMEAKELPDYLESLGKRKEKALQENKRIEFNHDGLQFLKDSFIGRGETINNPLLGLVKKDSLPDGSAVISKDTIRGWEFLYVQKDEIMNYMEEFKNEQKESLTRLTPEEISFRKGVLAMVG